MTELTISLDTKSSRPLYEQIYAYIKEEIQAGGLPFKERLPSSRNLAKYLQVSRSTVHLAYEQLLSEGYIESIPCRGYFVSELDGLCFLKQETEEEKEDKEEENSRYDYDFSPYGIDVASFPQSAWRKVSKSILSEENHDYFQLGDPNGEILLRRTIAEYLHQARGVNCTASQVIVGAGNDYLLMLLCTICGREYKIAMENPTYMKAYRVLKMLSKEMVTIPMDQEGMKVDALEKSGAEMAYVMPSHQYPLGTVMPIRRRMELLRWAVKKEGRYIIEDDYDSEFRYKGKPIPSLQGYDNAGKVVYIGTFSRSIAPSIRISYMVLPHSLLELYQRRGALFSSTVSRVDQMIITRFLKEGHFERHLNRMRAVYKGRHDLLLECLKQNGILDICRVSGENAGVHILLEFVNGMGEQKAIDQAANEGVRVYGLSDYCVDIPEDIREKTTVSEGGALPGIQATVMLGYANMKEEEIEEAVRRLGRAWHSL